MNKLTIILFFVFLFSCSGDDSSSEPESYVPDFRFEKLPQSWDEGIPLGNGMLGALIWEKDGKLRFSLDRADQWDLRPMKNLDLPELNFMWVVDQWEQNTYEAVQQKLDLPYEQRPAPTKIPGGGLEFDLKPLGEVADVNII